jgi:hypothetical protein
MKSPTADPRALKSQDQDPILKVPSVGAWDAWLRDNHDRSAGVFLRIPKKRVSESTLSYATALEAALAWGWIDGQKRALDEKAWLQRASRAAPREAPGPRSTGRKPRF